MASLYQQDLFALLPDDLPKPTKEHLALLTEVDETVHYDRDIIFQESGRLRNRIRDKMHPRTFKKSIFASVPRPGFVEKSDPDHPTAISEDVIAEHRRRIAFVSSFFTSPSFQDCTLEDGGTKSRKRTEQKIAMKTSDDRPHPAIADMSRMRVVVPELPMMARTIVRMAEGLYWDKSQIRIVEIIDWLYTRSLGKYVTPLRCANVVFQPLRPQNSQTRLLTEVQFVTRRMRAGMDLNHPFDVTGRLAYPSDEHKAWMHTVMMKAALIDYWNQLCALDR